MAVIEWDKTGEHFYETGVSNGVLYVYNSNADEDEDPYSPGVAWNGLSAVTESPSGGEESPIYADNVKYLSLRSLEEFGLTIEAYTYPDSWGECDGSATAGAGVMVGQQKRKSFGFCYKTNIGNDTDGNDLGYKLHLIYGCTAAPSERAYQTINDSPEAITFSWEIATIPVKVSDFNGQSFKPTSVITVDSRNFTSTAAKAKLTALEEKLYGTTDSDPYLPLPDEVFTTLLTVTPEDDDDEDGDGVG